MNSIIDYTQAALWAAALAGWLFQQQRLVLVIRKHIAEPMFNTDPDKTSTYFFRFVSCVLLVMAVGNVMDAMTRQTFESIATNVSGG